MRLLQFLCLLLFLNIVYSMHIKSSNHKRKNGGKVVNHDSEHNSDSFDDSSDNDDNDEDSNSSAFDEDPDIPSEDEDTLILVNVLFRHGNRTANGKEELYPFDPYEDFKYYPYGLGQLTKAGKLREYSIGKALRDRYDYFLGDNYYPEMVDARSTDYNRTKMSLELVLAGLFPPRKDDAITKDLIWWQPVPYNYLPKDSDFLLLGSECPHYKKIYKKYTERPEIKKLFKKHKKLFKFLSRSTNNTVSSFKDVYNLYFGLSTEIEYGLIQPSWTKYVWPEKIVKMAVQEYNISMGTKRMRKILAGTLLKKIITDMRKKLEEANKSFGKKIYLYSAHESNLAHMMIALGVFDGQIPNYGAYLIVELHMINKQPGVKIYYQNYYKSEAKLLRIPKCKDFCPLDKFEMLMEDILPKSEDKLCKS